MLNPTLYALLERRFGKGNVKIKAENQPMQINYVIDAYSDSTNIRHTMQILDSGEEYMVRCPFCNDYKHRLYINHRWAIYDDKTKSKNLWLANCWNTSCLSNKTNQLSLYDQVVDFTNIGSVTFKLNTAAAKTTEATDNRRITLPGALWPLDHLYKKNKQHPAIQYSEDRWWNPDILGRLYGVSYCIDSLNKYVSNRLVAPVYLNGKLVGWQARHIGESSKEIPKWYTCPGMRTGSCLYNFDRMKMFYTKVIVEGPADVWSFGPQACGLFNKVMSQKQRALFCSTFDSETDVAVILLDPGQDAVAKAKKQQHHIEKLYNELNREPRINGKVLKVYLPLESDPDELDRGYVRDLISFYGRQKGLNISFNKLKKDHARTENIST